MDDCKNLMSGLLTHYKISFKVKDVFEGIEDKTLGLSFDACDDGYMAFIQFKTHRHIIHSSEFADYKDFAKCIFRLIYDDWNIQKNV